MCCITIACPILAAQVNITLTLHGKRTSHLKKKKKKKGTTLSVLTDCEDVEYFANAGDPKCCLNRVSGSSLG